jgi:hypothetical protein
LALDLPPRRHRCQRETEILRGDQTSKLKEARNAVLEAQKKAPVERLIIEGYFTGQANKANVKRAEARAAATKEWLQSDEGGYLA